MKRMVFFSVLAIVLTALLTGTSSNNVVKPVPNIFSAIILLDGTDRLHGQSSTPSVDIEYLLNLVAKIQEKGKGELFLSFIDDDCANNGHAYLNILQAPKSPLTNYPKKKDYVTQAEYNREKGEKTKAFVNDSIAFANRLSSFKRKAQEIIQAAYSDQVAKNSRGSDINGGINLGVKLLSISKAPIAYLILVSDGVDNVGKPMVNIPDNIQILLVNHSVSPHQLKLKAELGNLEQLEDFIVNNL
jgi:hypothetical protein